MSRNKKPSGVTGRRKQDEKVNVGKKVEDALKKIGNVQSASKRAHQIAHLAGIRW